MPARRLCAGRASRQNLRRLAKGDQVLRFAVGRPSGARSATWRLWVPRGKSDVYLSRRMVGRNFKVSLHESGEWQIGLTQEYVKRPDALSMPKENPRGLDKWTRPEPQPRIAPGTHAFSIVIPWLEIHHRPGAEAGQIVWVQPPPPACCVQFDVFFVPPGVGDDAHPVNILRAEGFVGEVSLANGERALVACVARAMTTRDIWNARHLRSARETPNGNPLRMTAAES
jgi:hypothetical protein